MSRVVNFLCCPSPPISPLLGPDMEGIHEALETMSVYIRSSPRDSVISGLSAGHTYTSTEKLAAVSV